MFDDILDLKLNLSDSDLLKLDKLASKAEKRLEKAQKELEKRGLTGALAGEHPLTTQSFTRASGLIGKFGAPIQKENLAEEVKRQKGLLESMLQSNLGSGKASQVLRFMTNPTEFVSGMVFKALPVLAGLKEFQEIVFGVIELLTQKGQLLDVYFRDIINNRVDALRDKRVVESIRMGFTQIIVVTKAGSTNARDAYNTFALYNKDRQSLEDSFSIRKTSGVH